MKQGNLPDGFPSKDALAAADIHTFAQARNADLTEVEGIGPAKAAAIKAALDEADKAPPKTADAPKKGEPEGTSPTREESAKAVTNVDRDGSGDPGPGEPGTKGKTAQEADSARTHRGELGADARTEAELRDQAVSPALKRAVDESFGQKLAHSGFCFYDDPNGPYVANADTQRIEGKRIKVMPISMTVPRKGIEVYDGDDHYALTEDMGVTNFGEPGDWLKIRSPNTGLALIR